jgi:hypothetical protein
MMFQFEMKKIYQRAFFANVFFFHFILNFRRKKIKMVSLKSDVLYSQFDNKKKCNDCKS